MALQSSEKIPTAHQQNGAAGRVLRRPFSVRARLQRGVDFLHRTPPRCCATVSFKHVRCCLVAKQTASRIYSGATGGSGRELRNRRMQIRVTLLLFLFVCKPGKFSSRFIAAQLLHFFLGGWGGGGGVRPYFCSFFFVSTPFESTLTGRGRRIM